MCIENKFVFMLGDFSARIAQMDDFVEADPFIASTILNSTMFCIVILTNQIS